MDGASARTPSHDELRRRIDEELVQGWRLYVAMRDGRIVGMLALKPASAILDQLFVLPAERGRGVGKALLDMAKSVLQGGFELRVAASNAQGRRFYESEGLRFARAGAHPRTGASVCYYQWRIRSEG
jgi:GNAT superfamily N-acetyltransferase